MISVTVEILVVMFAAYTAVPTLLSRLLHKGVVWRGDARDARVALTFDDGPDPEYTPEVLRILREHDVKATFFVTGRNAERHEDIVRQIVDEGHEIGIHGYRHYPVWLFGPRKTREDIERACRIVEQITGCRPRWYRPPWGLVNWAVYPTLHKAGARFVLWSSLAWDWGRATSGDIRNRVLRKSRSGWIVVFHDSGQTFGASRSAPARMLAALPEVIRTLRGRGFGFATISELEAFAADSRREALRLPRGKAFLIRIWLIWEKVFEWIVNMDPVRPGKDNLFRLALRRYRGRPLLVDGTWIEKGDWMAELHLDNRRMLSIFMQHRSFDRGLLALIREVKSYMPLLAEYLASHCKYRHVKAVYGITLLHRGVEPFGFRVVQLKSKWVQWVTKVYLRVLMIVFHTEGRKRLTQRKEQLVPKMVLITVDRLRALYGSPLTYATDNMADIDGIRLGSARIE
jgi:peptidoglycan/xylan/chitin deacetylase (PgdA/CDA1 family)